MYFYDALHEANFSKMLEKFPQGKKDREYRVACYIIAHPEIFPKATRKDWDTPFDDWMEEEDLSSGFRLLVDLGLHLFGGGSHSFNLMDGISTWDTGNYSVFVQACEIRKGWA
ncbi:hypothetical protein J6TS7_32380 [Paenibacillus dendritiformis]|uniref:hypothetical protein n=1 Tax=Paenibacillus TaxID=44249 RepID=UPI001B1776B2|nr:hypothetical protein [Paenibacillus dendritiformis]GIO79628.1 hypothetical protein J6TS7_32380 [Paenibacillus dendritiformis]